MPPTKYYKFDLPNSMILIGSFFWERIHLYPNFAHSHITSLPGPRYATIGTNAPDQQ
jgi:hypothetical protein